MDGRIARGRASTDIDLGKSELFHCDINRYTKSDGLESRSSFILWLCWVSMSKFRVGYIDTIFGIE